MDSTFYKFKKKTIYPRLHNYILGDIMNHEEIEVIFKKLNLNSIDNKSNLQEDNTLKNSYPKKYLDMPKRSTKKEKKIIIWNFLPNKED